MYSDFFYCNFSQSSCRIEQGRSTIPHHLRMSFFLKWLVNDQNAKESHDLCFSFSNACFFFFFHLQLLACGEGSLECSDWWCTLIRWDYSNVLKESHAIVYFYSWYNNMYIILSKVHKLSPLKYNFIMFLYSTVFQCSLQRVPNEDTHYFIECSLSPTMCQALFESLKLWKSTQCLPS